MYNYIETDPEQLEFIQIATTDELQEGERLLIDIEGDYFAVFKVAGEYYAIADLCSHDDGPLAEGDVEGHEVICPRHGARFDMRSGKALTLPAVVDIPAYPVKIEGDAILVGLPLGD
ncbi:MAG: Rieske 2Fe-2S domain-containing protein [Anaerolineales bacterium]|nr:Rieske 2Fe-2S domain-containing protein [Anaerolineales bacterium]